MEKDLLTLILESIEKAQQRTRRAFFLNLLVSSLVLIFAFNFSISQGNAKPPRPDSTGDTEEYKIQLARYFNRYTYSIPIIGVTISADDFAFFGPLALFIFSFYYVSCSRNSDTQLRNLHKRMDATPLDREILAVALESEVVLNTSSHIPHHMKWLRTLIGALSFQQVNLYRLLLLLPLAAALTAMASEVRATYFVKGGFYGGIELRSAGKLASTSKGDFSNGSGSQ